MERVTELVKYVAEQQSMRIKTSVLNELIRDAVSVNPPPTKKGSSSRFCCHAGDIVRRRSLFSSMTPNSCTSLSALSKIVCARVSASRERNPPRGARAQGGRMMYLAAAIARLSHWIDSGSGLILGRLIWHKDLRDYSSHNIGATNAWRTLGRARVLPYLLRTA